MDQSKIIEVEARNVYGNTLIYPVNALAQQFADLIGTRTFSRKHIAKLREMGFTVGQVIAEITV